MSGVNETIDLYDLQKFTHYKGYSPTSTVVQHFWKLLKTFSNEEIRLLIKFVTSCSRPPLLGFKYLNPPFTLQAIQDTDRLPIASTCFNILKLPPYNNMQLLKEKLMKSITMAKGFALT